MSKKSNSKRKVKRSKRKSRYKAHTFSGSPNIMNPSKNSNPVMDTCNVCNMHKKLEFDHVPPKSTLEIIKKFGFQSDYKDVLLIDSSGFEHSKSGVVQKLGFKTVCRKCNGISSGYINEYNDMIYQLLSYIKLNGIDYTGSVEVKIDTLAVIKQIIYMFLVQNSEIKYYGYHKWLYRLFRDETLICNNLSDHLLVYMGLCRGHDFVYHPDICATIDMSGFTSSDVMDINMNNLNQAVQYGVIDNIIAFPPFCYRMIAKNHLTENINTNGLIDITDFSLYRGLSLIKFFCINTIDIGLPPFSLKSSLLESGITRSTI